MQNGLGLDSEKARFILVLQYQYLSEYLKRLKPVSAYFLIFPSLVRLSETWGVARAGGKKFLCSRVSDIFVRWSLNVIDGLWILGLILWNVGLSFVSIMTSQHSTYSTIGSRCEFQEIPKEVTSTASALQKAATLSLTVAKAEEESTQGIPILGWKIGDQQRSQKWSTKSRDISWKLDIPKGKRKRPLTCGKFFWEIMKVRNHPHSAGAREWQFIQDVKLERFSGGTFKICMQHVFFSWRGFI